MTNNESDLEELKNLQQEARSKRAKRTRSTNRETPGDEQTAAEQPTTEQSTAEQSATESMADITNQVDAFVKQVEEAAGERPLLALLAVFVTGVLVGQLISRK